MNNESVRQSSRWETCWWRLKNSNYLQGISWKRKQVRQLVQMRANGGRQDRISICWSTLCSHKDICTLKDRSRHHNGIIMLDDHIMLLEVNSQLEASWITLTHPTGYIWSLISYISATDSTFYSFEALFLDSLMKWIFIPMSITPTVFLKIWFEWFVLQVAAPGRDRRKAN